MGATESKQKLGERVLAARKKLAEDKKMQSERCEYLESVSPETMKFAIESISASFKSCSPFLEAVLLVAWQYDAEQCQKIILDSCQKVLSSPIIPEEYNWFKQYVFHSSVWLLKSTQNRYMFEELMRVTSSMSKDIINTMDSIYNHLTFHPKWRQLMEIKNTSIVSRQDHKNVGLLQQNGIRNIVEKKESDEKMEAIRTFVDSNLAINVLTTTAKNIDDEFQDHIKAVMSHYGDFKAGPMKKVERCLSKIENDYKDANYPKAAKLLDLVRCSVTFNTIEQLLGGYKGLMNHIKTSSNIIELSRIKNGFLDAKYDGGYRDIKVNVIYHSPVAGVSMICEIQLLFGQYLYEKKRIHKLYSIIRQELYFEMIVQKPEASKTLKDPKDLQFNVILDVRKDINTSLGNEVNKCSIDSQLELLGIEAGPEHFTCIDIKEKKEIFSIKLAISDYIGRHSHHFITFGDCKHLSVQTHNNIIKMYRIKEGSDHDANRYSFEENENLRITLTKQDTINCCEFDEGFKNIIIIKNGNIVERRKIGASKAKPRIIKLKHWRVQQTDTKMMCLSNDGQFCVVATGAHDFFYLVDIKNKKEHRLHSKVLKSTQAPCFINGEKQFVAVADSISHIEIWDVFKRKAIQTLTISKFVYIPIFSMYSTNNILAVGSNNSYIGLLLVNVTDWNMFETKINSVISNSLHLTNDSKYITIGGDKNCKVLQIC